MSEFSSASGDPHRFLPSNGSIVPVDLTGLQGAFPYAESTAPSADTSGILASAGASGALVLRGAEVDAPPPAQVEVVVDSNGDSWDQEAVSSEQQATVEEESIHLPTAGGGDVPKDPPPDLPVTADSPDDDPDEGPDDDPGYLPVIPQHGVSRFPREENDTPENIARVAELFWDTVEDSLNNEDVYPTIELGAGSETTPSEKVALLAVEERDGQRVAILVASESIAVRFMSPDGQTSTHVYSPDEQGRIRRQDPLDGEGAGAGGAIPTTGVYEQIVADSNNLDLGAIILEHQLGMSGIPVGAEEMRYIDDLACLAKPFPYSVHEIISGIRAQEEAPNQAAVNRGIVLLDELVQKHLASLVDNYDKTTTNTYTDNGRIVIEGLRPPHWQTYDLGTDNANQPVQLKYKPEIRVTVRQAYRELDPGMQEIVRLMFEGEDYGTAEVITYVDYRVGGPPAKPKLFITSRQVAVMWHSDSPHVDVISEKEGDITDVFRLKQLLANPRMYPFLHHQPPPENPEDQERN